MTIRQWIIRQARRRGYDIVRYSLQSEASTRFIKLLTDHSVDVVLDIGANIGQYGDSLRSIGYAGTIISFEPASAAFMELKKKTERDRQWRCERLGVGATAGKSVLHVSANSQSSSFLDMLPLHSEAAPTSGYLAAEEIEVTTVDAIIENSCGANDRVFLKVDTQGFERLVLEGARRSLPRIEGIELEMSIVPLYRGETLFHEMVAEVCRHGFVLTSLEPMFFHPRTGQLLQVNGTFFRINDEQARVDER